MHDSFQSLVMDRELENKMLASANLLSDKIISHIAMSKARNERAFGVINYCYVTVRSSPT